MRALKMYEEEESRHEDDRISPLKNERPLITLRLIAKGDPRRFVVPRTPAVLARNEKEKER